MTSLESVLPRSLPGLFRLQSVPAFFNQRFFLLSRCRSGRSEIPPCSLFVNCNTNCVDARRKQSTQKENENERKQRNKKKNRKTKKWEGPPQSDSFPPDQMLTS